MNHLKQENTESLIRMLSAAEGTEAFLTAEMPEDEHISFHGELPNIPPVAEDGGLGGSGQSGDAGGGLGGSGQSGDAGGADGGGQSGDAGSSQNGGDQSGDAGGSQNGGADGSGSQDGGSQNSGDPGADDEEKAGSPEEEKSQRDGEDKTEQAAEEETQTGGGFTESIGQMLTRENLPATIGIGAGLLLILVLILFAHREQKKKRENSRKQKEEQPGSMRVAQTVGGPTVTEPAVSGGRTDAAGGCRIGKVHEIGRRRDQQDSFGTSDYTDTELCRRNGLLLVVADGMGGLANGAAVSQMAVRTCMDLFYATTGRTPQRRLAELAAGVNRSVNQMLAGQSERSGSTLVTALIDQGRLYFLTVGDSRIYLYRAGGLICLNRPHVYAEELMVDAVNGARSMDAMDTDGQRASLTSYVGAGRLKYVDRNAEGIRLLEGDKIMLSSDGVFGTISEAQIEQALSLAPEQAAESIHRMVEAAGRSGQDNYTAVILEYHNS